MAFLDFKKAFNTIELQILLQKTGRAGLDPRAQEFLANYLSNRKQFTRIGGMASDPRGVRTGVPQGSTLGPLLILKRYTVGGKDVRLLNPHELIAASCLWCLDIQELTRADNRVFIEHISFISIHAKDDYFKDSAHVDYVLSVRSQQNMQVSPHFLNYLMVKASYIMVLRTLRLGKHPINHVEPLIPTQASPVNTVIDLFYTH